MFKDEETSIDITTNINSFEPSSKTKDDIDTMDISTGITVGGENNMCTHGTYGAECRTSIHGDTFYTFVMSSHDK
jgi:hypothetical protein